jgi:hypothetical protein
MRDGKKEIITINTPKTQTPYTAKDLNPKPKTQKWIKKKKKKKTSSLLSHPFLSMPDLDIEVKETVSNLKQESDPQSKTTKSTFCLFLRKIKIMERFIENLPPMDLMRSEKMTFVQLIIPVESAHRAVSYLGELGLLQFCDVSFC